MRKITTISTLISLLLFAACVSERADARPSQLVAGIADPTKIGGSPSNVETYAVDQEVSPLVAVAPIEGGGERTIAIVTVDWGPAASATFLPTEAACGLRQVARVAPTTFLAAARLSYLREFFFFMTGVLGTSRDASRNIVTWSARC